MDNTPFEIKYKFRDRIITSLVKPTMRLNDVVDFMVHVQGQFVFALTKNAADGQWFVSLKDSDNVVDDEIINMIGHEIERLHQKTSETRRQST